MVPQIEQRSYCCKYLSYVNVSLEDFTEILNHLQKYWGIQVNNIKVGSTSVVSTFDTIVDTGTTLIILDNSIATKLYKSIKGAKYNDNAAMWEVPCKSLKSLPDITFTIHNKPYTLTPEQYTVPEWEVRTISTFSLYYKKT